MVTNVILSLNDAGSDIYAAIQYFMWVLFIRFVEFCSLWANHKIYLCKYYLLNSKYYIFNIALCINRDGHPVWGALTLTFTLMPFLFSLVTHKFIKAPKKRFTEYPLNIKVSHLVSWVMQYIFTRYGWSRVIVVQLYLLRHDHKTDIQFGYVSVLELHNTHSDTLYLIFTLKILNCFLL